MLYRNSLILKSIELNNNIYRPQRSCGKVIFSQASVILSMGVYPSMHWGRHPPWADIPWADTPPGQTPLLGRHPLRQTPLADTLWADTPNPLGRHPQAVIPWADTLWADTPLQTSPWQTSPCPVNAGIHPCAQCMVGYTPLVPSAWWDTPPPLSDGHCCGRYASYWNAFLFRGLFSSN